MKITDITKGTLVGARELLQRFSRYDYLLHKDHPDKKNGYLTIWLLKIIAARRDTRLKLKISTQWMFICPISRWRSSWSSQVSWLVPEQRALLLTRRWWYTMTMLKLNINPMNVHLSTLVMKIILILTGPLTGARAEGLVADEALSRRLDPWRQTVAARCLLLIHSHQHLQYIYF